MIADAIDTENLLLAALIAAAALLYSSVGHGGASGYLAAMALFGVAPAVMKPTALALNVLVSLIATVRFYRVGAFSWQLFLPLIIASVPMAYLGGVLTLPASTTAPWSGWCCSTPRGASSSRRAMPTMRWRRPRATCCS